MRSSRDHCGYVDSRESSLGANAISFAGGYNVLFAWERVVHRPDLSLVSPEFSPQRLNDETTLVSYARVLLTLVVGCRTFLVASLIDGAMLLNLLVGGMLLIPAS